MSARGNTVARIACGGVSSSPSKDLVAFAKTLKRMTGFPFFAGLRIRISEIRHDSRCENLDESAIQLICAKSVIKYLQIKFVPMPPTTPTLLSSNGLFDNRKDSCCKPFWQLGDWLGQKSESSVYSCSTSRLLTGFLNENSHELTEISLDLWA